MVGVNPIWGLFIVIFLFFPMTYSEDEVVKQALVRFMDKLAQGNPQRDAKYLSWNLSSDPCNGNWYGVSCLEGNVNTIVVDDSSLRGTLDASSLCMAKSLQSLSLKKNNLHGLIPEDIGTCKSLNHLYLSENNFSGDLPISLAELGNLERLNIASNNFSGELYNVIHVSGLISFLAENNKFTGEIPDFNFSKLLEFNVSNNNLEGPLPDFRGGFQVDSFSGNPNLCGTPLPKACPPTPPPHAKKDIKSFIDGLAIYSGYVILGVMVLFFFAFKLVRKLKTKEEALIVEMKEVAEETSGERPREISSETRSSIGMKSEYSMSSLESGMNTSTLVVFSNPASKELQLEDLLKAPAELIGRGKKGSLYKVMLDNGFFLAVKRIKDWGIPKQDFGKRMAKIGQVKHPYVLPPVAYYCSRDEKLLAYEYMENGNLFKMLCGSPSGQSFDWGSRLNVAAKIADALAYMHEELCGSGIAHGNLKSSNILFGKNMDPYISEYGLMVSENKAQSAISQGKSLKNKSLSAASAHAYNTFKVDTYAFGVILLELLTGKVVENSGFNLAKWVSSVLREEWTFEVFDKSLISQGASEERMVNLLQVALKCINPSPTDRPSMSEVAVMTITLKEEEERYITFESSTH
ncbi:probable inactive receptor kinase At2g26730 [Gastrolobium bilobum]|uniref:probable inactive receptor kinase At2g26730 n=1 Tax=Gastrolobium bilobum TaxID=150636 RepID=UPI002AB317C9|nr:probable inactive receptor kinase At2g26730 [Gastrolobium bilobum]